MASVLQKLLHPLFSGPPEPPRNKVTVVGVGQVGMACAVTILLRVRVPAFTFAPVNPFPAGLAGCLQTVPRLLTLSQCVDRLMNTPAVTHGSFPPPPCWAAATTPDWWTRWLLVRFPVLGCSNNPAKILKLSQHPGCKLGFSP